MKNTTTLKKTTTMLKFSTRVERYTRPSSESQHVQNETDELEETDHHAEVQHLAHEVHDALILRKSPGRPHCIMQDFTVERNNDKGGVAIIVRQVVCELDVSRLTSLNRQVRDQGTVEATSSSAQESQQVQNETDTLKR